MLAAAVLLTACGGGHDGGGSTTMVRGSLVGAPVTAMALDVADVTTQINAASPAVLQVASAPQCGVTMYSIRYRTIGGMNEPTIAGGTIMMPTGTAAVCNGAHPVVLYGHGTSADKNFDMSKFVNDLNGQIDGALVAGFYAAQGYVVVAPNYAGYTGSTLPYHPFVNAIQQSSDMIDALRAARSTFAQLGITDSGKLYVTGYSQGGFVAMATQRAMQADPVEFKVTATATGSGPYALSTFLDAEFNGEVSAGAPALLDLLIDGWQNSYGNVLTSPADIFAPPFASDAFGLLPSTSSETTLFSTNALPETAAFQTGSLPGPNTSDPDTAILAEVGFAPSNFFVTTAYRTSVVNDIQANACTNPTTQAPIRPCSPMVGLRQDALLNDLRTFVPNVPLQLCGAHSDGAVFFFNTQLESQFLTAQGMPASNLTVIDVDPGSNAPSGPFAALQTGFAAARAQAAASFGSTETGQIELANAIHTVAEPFCFSAARSLFQSTL
jgi:pimeloyl-ACP methyl ester carboxylesterase